MSLEDNEQLITLESEDGPSYTCRVLDVFEFDNKEYALLLNLGRSDVEDQDNEGSTVIMQLLEKDDQVIFRTIESDGEFERVVAYLKGLAELAKEDL